MMMTNGFGAVIGSSVSGYLIDKYFTINGTKDWYSIWISFAIYALIIAIAFAFLFRHKHNPEELLVVNH
jgi:NHS family xanthosine MFS transporter